MISHIKFNSVKKFTELLFRHFEKDETFVVVCTYKMASNIFKNIMTWDSDVDLASIHIEKANIGGYADEYIISFVGNELYINPLRFEDGSLPTMIADKENYTYFEKSVVAEVLDLASDTLMIFDINDVKEA